MRNMTKIREDMRVKDIPFPAYAHDLKPGEWREVPDGVALNDTSYPQELFDVMAEGIKMLGLRR